MREDMSKVVIERPRHGHWMPSAKTKLRIKQYDPENEYDDQPKRVTASKLKHSFGRKYFSDLLGPLRRYLRSNVGRPWDKVYSEMKQHLDDRKTTGRHIFEHVEREVALNCYLGADGKVYQHDSWLKDRPVSGLYVHPRTKLLCWKDSNKGVQQKVTPASLITPLQDGRYRIKLEGIWYTVQLEYVGETDATPDGNRWSSAEQATKETFQQGRRVWRFKNKRQYSSKELKAAKLQNDAPAD
jgi:hypothetical protein